MHTFDFMLALPAYTSSGHTQRAYYRWVDRYLVDMANMKPTHGDERLARMRQLSLKTLTRILTPRRLQKWLTMLSEEGLSRQTLDQARAAIVALAEVLAREKWLEADQAQAIRAVSAPLIEKKASSGRLLSTTELRLVISAARDIATTPQQQARNNVIAMMLCTIALRREELSSARWGDLSTSAGTVLLKMDTSLPLVLPASVVAVIDAWRHILIQEIKDIPPHSPLIRRIWKGGRIAKDGLSPDGIWLTIRNASAFAGLGYVTPDDLRRSAVVGMLDAGIPIDDISRLLRHRSVLITERFLARIAQGEDIDDLG